MLFKSSRHKTIKIGWQYIAQHSIWRIIISDEGYFVCEDRDKENKSVSFFCLEQATGKIMWKDLRFEEPWWIGIEACYKEYLFFHEFATPDMPDHKKIHAHNLRTGERLWRNTEERFLFAANDAVFTSKDLFERRIFRELDIATGEFRGEVDVQRVNSVRDSLPEPVLQVQFPSILNPVLLQHEQMKASVAHATSKTKYVALIEFLEHEGLHIIGYYDNISSIPDNPQLEQCLVVIDPSLQKIIYNDHITSGVMAPIPDTFFCSGSNIYLVKDKNILTALEIAK
ncbi:MAG: DUF4905 domain-containing protein [Bacteroidota bacterium]